MAERITASEALYGFAAWLTTRQEVIKVGASCDCVPVVDVVKQWCGENNLPMPRDGIYPDNVMQPSE